MADNTTITAGTGTTIAADDVGGVLHQRVKVSVGADGSAADMTAGAGAVAAGTPRVTLASDDPAVTSLATIAGDTTDIETAVELIDDTVATVAAAITTKGIAAAGTDGTNARILKTDSSGELQVDVLSIAAGTNNIGDVDILSIAAGTNNIGDVDIASIAAGDNNIGNVDVVTLPNVTLAAGTNTNEVVGDAADDAAAAGNPVLIGGTMKSFDGTDPGALSAENDAGSLTVDNNRRLYVNDVHPRFWAVSADYAAAQTNASVKAAPGASLSLYVTDIQISNGATAGNVTLLDGSGGTVLYEVYPAINGGAVLNLRTPIRLTANTALCITSTTVTTHSVFVAGYIAP